MSLLWLLMFSGIGAQQRDLSFYLDQAKINSPLINQNQNESKIVMLDLQQINSILSKPEINLISGVMFAPVISHDNNSNHFELVSDGATNYTGYDLALTDGGQYQAVVSVRQPLFTGSRYKTYADKASISSQINANNIALTIHELEQIVGYQYILCLKSKMQINNELSLLRELDEQVMRMQRLVENAIYKQTDLMLLQIEVQNYEAEYRMLQGEYVTNIYDLNLICGIRDTSLADIQETDFVLKPAIVLNSNFLTGYRLDSLNIIADQSINELKYKPQLDLFADAGLFAAYLPYPERIGFSTGVSFSWNIFDGHQRDIQREKSNISLQTLEFEKNNFFIQNDISKNKILNQIETIDQRLRLYEQQAEQYDRLYNAYSMELSLGEASVMDFKNLLKDIAAKKQETLLLKMERQLLINSYNYLTY
jgi:outer membrane protein TolC